jgi:hypothetical protein
MNGDLEEEIRLYEEVKGGIAKQYMEQLLHGTKYAQEICYKNYLIADKMLNKIKKQMEEKK